MSQKTREKKKRILASALCVMMLLFSLSAYAMTARLQNIPFTLTPNTNGYGSVSLDWSQYNYSNKNFKVYKSSDGGNTYETVGIDYKSVKEVKCLQVYPADGAANQLKVWMENNGYGKGIIKVDSVYIDTFNANPYEYLKDSSGNWKYDVIFFGTWDSNGGKDLSRASRDAVISYIKAGKGVILGHDTLASSNESTINDWYFNTLATYFGMSFYNDNGQYSFGQTFYNGSNMIRIAKKGLLTNYPWEIGDVGTTFHIPYTHNSGQYASKATIWMDFGTTYYPGIAPERSDLRLPNAYNLKTNFYVSIYNNCAMIMTGDSSGKASDNEEKVLANLIFYMNQLLFNTYTTTDASAQDVAKPNTPNVSQNNSKMSYSADDNGSTYWYYVESFSKDDTTASGLIDRSEKKSLTVTTGVKNYRYLFSNNATETLTTSKGTETTGTTVPVNYGYKYFHVAAVDGAGNISDTKSVEVKRQFNLNFNYNKPSNASHDITGNEIASKKVTYQEKYGDLPNPSLTGWKFKGWYTSATGGTQVSKDTIYEATVDSTVYAYWEPIKYTIRFNGNNNWNTSQGTYDQIFTYDVKQKLTPNKFTRPNSTTYNNIYYERGYKFVGWGTSPTQKTATYTDKQEVKNLTASDGASIDLYAIWEKPITLTINFNGGQFNNDSASKVLEYTMYNSELNHTFDIKPYYGGFKNNRISANKGINNKLTKTDTNGIQYRFLGYSLNKNATVPDTQFDVYSLSRTENYTIRDNTTLYAVWEPVLQMTVQLSAPQHSGVMQLTSDVPVTTTLGNFKIPSGTRSTDIPSSATASANTATIGTNVSNKDLVTYTVSAKGASNIKFSTAADSRILDIYTHGNNNTWFDKLNTTDKFEYAIDNFSNITSSFTIPQYIGTKKSYKTSNPESAIGTSVYAIKFTCTQPSYYYNKYWNSPESTSVYGILFLNPTLPDDNTNGGIILPPYAVEDGAYEFETILN